jgi:thiol-disulfide isomerase/thioredoxin
MRNFLKNILAIAAIFFAMASVHAQNSEVKREAFSQAKFEALQASGAVVLIDVYAPWCPTCQAQQKVFAKYQADNPTKKFTILVVDYDKDKDIVRQFHAPRQATLLLYRGKAQHWFSVAESRQEVIAAELDKAINYNYN